MRSDIPECTFLHVLLLLVKSQNRHSLYNHFFTSDFFKSNCCLLTSNDKKVMHSHSYESNKQTTYSLTKFKKEDKFENFIKQFISNIY